MKNYKILIIDDERESRIILRTPLEDFDNLSIFEATSGEKGIEAAGQLKPDLILLDNKMPGMSGEAASKILKGDPLTKNIPIVMITSMRLDSRQIELIKLDVDEYIEKPLYSWKIKKTVIGFLKELKDTEDTIDLGDI